MCNIRFLIKLFYYKENSMGSAVVITIVGCIALLVGLFGGVVQSASRG